MNPINDEHILFLNWVLDNYRLSHDYDHTIHTVLRGGRYSIGSVIQQKLNVIRHVHSEEYGLFCTFHNIMSNIKI